MLNFNTLSSTILSSEKISMRTMLLLFTLLFNVHAMAQEAVMDIVFDLDWTLLYPLKDKPNSKFSRVIEASDELYRIADGTEDILLRLHEMPNVRISFYSGGNTPRNIEALKKIQLANGQNAFDIAYKILNVSDLAPISNDESLPFTQRFKKDLTRINSDISRVILVDDSKNFVLPEQYRHQLWLGKTYNYYESFNEVPGIKDNYDPPNLKEWMRERNKLYSVYEAILEVYVKKELPNAIEYLPKELPFSGPCNLHFH